MNKINFLEYSNGKPIYDIGEYYTNADIMILKNLCFALPQEMIAQNAKNIDINKVIDETIKYKNYLPAEDRQDLKGKMIFDTCYLELIVKLLEDSENKDYLTNKYSAVKIMRGEILAALIMPKIVPLTPQQENFLMLNSFVEYCQYKDLIPIEYDLVGEDGHRGLFVPRLLPDNYIKKMIRGQIKHIGGRWLGKYRRMPEKLEDYSKQVVEITNNIDRSKIIKDMNEKMGVQA